MSERESFARIADYQEIAACGQPWRLLIERRLDAGGPARGDSMMPRNLVLFVVLSGFASPALRAGGPRPVDFRSDVIAAEHAVAETAGHSRWRSG
jgi:hypothetical protein